MKHIPKGIQYMLISSLCFAGMGLFFKLLKHVPIAEIIFYKTTLGLLISFAMLVYKKIPMWGNNQGMLLLRGVSNGLGIALFFITLVRLPLSMANVIQNTSPIFTAILGIFMLRESVSLRRWMFFLLAFVGVWLTAMQGFSMNSQSIYLVILGLVSALLMGVSNNLSAKLKVSEHPLVILNYANICVGVLTGICCLYTFVWPTLYQGLLLMGLSIVAYIAEYLAIRAYQLAPIAHVSAISYLGIPYALLIDLLLGERFHWVAFLGMGLVILGVLLSLIWGKE
jgi:drug/metabolite transporter (DMT)-like permease